MLAAKVLQEQGIEVLGLSFVTPFFSSEKAQAAARQLGITLKVLDITGMHLDMLKNPKHGYGSNMNPCIDCHALMLREAGKLMKAECADFIFTGEVLGERPMSQNRASLGVVARESGYKEYVLRPLSAKLLDETKPEIDGIVDREKLLDFNGRSRKRQFELAAHYGIKDYPNPASGCRLTEPGFTRRLKDLWANTGDMDPEDIELLKYGRHLRLNKECKLVVGRNEKENGRLMRLVTGQDTVINIPDYPGPIAILRGKTNQDIIDYAASVCATYSDTPKGVKVDAVITRDGGDIYIKAERLQDDKFKEQLI